MNKILLVDDDVNILNGLKRLLHKKYEMLFAVSGKEAIELAKSNKDIAVVVSDYKMPEMDGNELLSSLKTIIPDAVRMMLTGYADIEASIKAINEGRIFRFLTKPCPSELLSEAIDEGIKQYNLVISERELFQQTLRGTIKLLIEILEVASPFAFSKSMRLRDIVRKLSQSYSETLATKIELAALLSQIGLISLPSDVLEKIQKGNTLTPTEMKLYLLHPEISQKLLSNIPRLEDVSLAISLQNKKIKELNLQASGDISEDTLTIAKILNKAIEVDNFLEGKRKEEESRQELEIKELANKNKKIVQDFLRISELQPGMILDLDVVDKNGVILLSKGQEVTTLMKLRLQGYLELGRIYNLVKVRPY
jgi:CheY-like chemotaxis protein